MAPLTGQDIRDLFQVQALIAGELAARAAAIATEQDIAELKALHHELIAAASRNNHEVLEEKNHAFHREINLMADSRKIAWALELVTRYVPRGFYSAIEGWPAATVEDHIKLLEGIRAKKPPGPRCIWWAHLTRLHCGLPGTWARRDLLHGTVDAWDVLHELVADGSELEVDLIVDRVSLRGGVGRGR